MYFGFKKFADINIFLSLMAPYLCKDSTVSRLPGHCEKAVTTKSPGIPGTNLINLEGWKAESTLQLHYSSETRTPELWILTTRWIHAAKKHKKFNEIFQLAVTLTNKLGTEEKLSILCLWHIKVNNIISETAKEYWERSAWLTFLYVVLAEKNLASIKKKEYMIKLRSFTKFLIFMTKLTETASNNVRKINWIIFCLY